MKLPKIPIPFKRNVETEGVENIEDIETDKKSVKIGNVDDVEENVEATGPEATNTIIKILLKNKPVIVALISWAIMEIFKVPKIIQIPIYVLILYFGYFVVIPKPNEVLVVERLGVTQKKLLERLMQTSVTCSTDISKNPFRRLTFLIPFIDKIVKRVSLAHIPFEMPPYEAETRRGTNVWLNSKAFIEVINPLAFTYNTENVPRLIHDSTKTQILALAGQMELEDIRRNVDPINKKLAEDISTFVDASYYGFRLVAFVIQSVDVPDDINEAMAKREKARLEGEAAKEKAEKELEVAKLQARRKIEDAKGDANAMSLRSIEEGKRQERLLQPFVNAGIADLYAKSLIFDKLPENATLFLGGEKGISQDAAYVASKLEATKTPTPESNSTKK